MTDNLQAQSNGLERCYSRSFRSYAIPFQAEHIIPYGATEGLTTFYITLSDKCGQVVEFVKILVQRDAMNLVNFAETMLHVEAPTYYAVVRPAHGSSPIVGKQISYLETADRSEYFVADPGEADGTPNFALLRKTEMFTDNYRYWPNGQLKHRVQTQSGHHQTVWDYDEDGRADLAALALDPQNASDHHAPVVG